jgi:hypothetical protein
MTSIEGVDGVTVMRSWSLKTMKSYPRASYQRTGWAGGVALSPELPMNHDIHAQTAPNALHHFWIGEWAGAFPSAGCAAATP